MSSANTSSVHKTTSTNTTPSNMRQQGLTTKISANNVNTNHIPQLSQISQNPLTQYISTNSHIVASVSSKPVVPSVISAGRRKMAEYKPASPPSPTVTHEQPGCGGTSTLQSNTSTYTVTPTTTGNPRASPRLMVILEW